MQTSAAFVKKYSFWTQQWHWMPFFPMCSDVDVFHGIQCTWTWIILTSIVCTYSCFSVTIHCILVANFPSLLSPEVNNFNYIDKVQCGGKVYDYMKWTEELPFQASDREQVSTSSSVYGYYIVSADTCRTVGASYLLKWTFV